MTVMVAVGVSEGKTVVQKFHIMQALPAFVRKDKKP